MAIEPNLVKFAIGLFSDDLLNNEQIEELGALLDSREELFAYLLTHPVFLQKNPDVHAELLKLAQQHGQGAMTLRQTMAPPAGTQEAVAELQRAILAKIVEETANEAMRSNFDEADRKFVRYVSADAYHEVSPERWIRR